MNPRPLNANGIRQAVATTQPDRYFRSHLSRSPTLKPQTRTRSTTTEPPTLSIPATTLLDRSAPSH